MHKRSNPIPVSTCCAGNFSSEPSALRLNSMKTLFQISTTCGWSLFTKLFPETWAFSSAVLKSTWISEQGPHGPWSPISQKLSFLFPKMIRSSSINVFQISQASWSNGTFSDGFPSKTETYRFSFGIL
ncbi:hypothetical protein D3C80_1686080 [compost metagenome]